MATLVQIPWQPGYYLTPDTLAYLIAAGNKLNTRFVVNDAWRSYSEQAYYYDQYLHHGGPPASNPDTGQRNHMRGAAFDAERTDAAAQLAFRSVGLIRDGVETWHWNNPNWQNMPIILTNTSAAGGNSKPIDNNTPTIEDEDMPTSIVMQEPNGTLWLLPEDGSMTALKDMGELAALIQTDAIKMVNPEAKGNDRYWVRAAQNTIDLRKALASRKGALK